MWNLEYSDSRDFCQEGVPYETLCTVRAGGRGGLSGKFQTALIFELPPARRMVLEKAQDTPVYKYPARVGKVRVNTGRWGTIPVWLVDPGVSCQPANVIFLYPRRRLGVRKLPHP